MSGTQDNGAKEAGMRATVNRAALVAALTYVCKGIPSRPGVPALAGVVLSVTDGTLTLRTFDWETLRTVEVPADDSVAGTVAVGGRTLLATAKALKAKTVALSATGCELTLSADGQTITQATMPVEDMPDVPGATDHVIGTMDAASFARMVAVVAPAAGTDETLPALTGIRVRTDGARIDMTATDRYRAHTVTGEWKPATDTDGSLVAPGSEYAVPAKLLADVSALFVKRAGKRTAEVTITAGPAMAGGMACNAYGLECDGVRVRTVTLDGYPAVEKVFPSKVNGTVSVSGADLVAKITGVCAGATRKAHGNVITVFDTDASVIRLEYWTNDSDDKPAGTASVPATYAGDVPDEMCFNPFYLIDAVTGATSGPDGTVQLATTDTLRPVVVTGDESPARNLVMCIRISGRSPSPAPAPVATPNVPAVTDAASADASVPADTAADDVPAVSVPVSVPETAPAAPARKRDPKRALRSLVARLTPAGTMHGADIFDDGTVSVKGARPTDEQISKIMGEPYRFAARVPGIVGHYDRFVPVAAGAPVAGQDSATDATARPLIDGRAALADMITGTVPESRAVAILPAGALAAVTRDPRPADFAAYRDEIGLCECPLCNEMAYVAHHWCNRADQVHAARVLLAHLAAGTHERMTLADKAQEARAHRADLVRIAEASGVTGEALDRVRDPHSFLIAEQRAQRREEFEKGLGLGIGDAPIRAEREARLAAERASAGPADGVSVTGSADSDPVSVPESVPAPSADGYAGMVREIIAGATWSYGSGTIGGGKRQRGTRFHGPIMHPALPDRRLSRDEWTALADRVRALGGGAWMRDVKGFACESADVGNPWKAATLSTRERVAAWLAETDSPAPETADVPAVPAVEATETADEGDALAVTVPDVSDAVDVPSGRTVHTFGSTDEAYAAVNTGEVPDGGVLNVPGEKVVGFANEAWPVAVTVERGAFHRARDLNGPEFDRYRDSIETARALALAGTAIGYALADEVAEGQDSARDVEQAGDAGDVPSDGGHPLAIDPGKPVTVTLVYDDRGQDDSGQDDSDAVADEQGAGGVESGAGMVHGAHAQRVHVSGAGEFDGYRIHLIKGVGCRQFAKPVRHALTAAYGRGSFHVTTPSGSGAVNVAAAGEVADWPAVLAVVAGVLGDSVQLDECTSCERSRALADS